MGTEFDKIRNAQTELKYLATQTSIFGLSDIIAADIQVYGKLNDHKLERYANNTKLAKIIQFKHEPWTSPRLKDMFNQLNFVYSHHSVSKVKWGELNGLNSLFNIQGRIYLKDNKCLQRMCDVDYNQNVTREYWKLLHGVEVPLELQAD